jgi:aldose 1-epimerase
MIKIDQRPTQLEKNNIFLFRLTNTNGSYIECSNYGASLVSIVVPIKNIYRNIILNYSTFMIILSDRILCWKARWEE